MRDDFDRWLARQARAQGLDLGGLERAGEAQLRAFCEAALRELAARGLVKGEAELGCYARPRSADN